MSQIMIKGPAWPAMLAQVYGSLPTPRVRFDLTRSTFTINVILCRELLRDSKRPVPSVTLPSRNNPHGCLRLRHQSACSPRCRKCTPARFFIPLRSIFIRIGARAVTMVNFEFVVRPSPPKAISVCSILSQRLVMNPSTVVQCGVACVLTSTTVRSVYLTSVRCP